MVHFWNIEVTTPVVGKLGRLFPRVYPPVTVCTNVTNNPIEEKLRLTVSFHTETIHFCHHEATGSCLVRRHDLCEDVSMEYGEFDAVVRSPPGAGRLLHAKAALGYGGHEHQVEEQTGLLTRTRSKMNCRYDLSLDGIVGPNCPWRCLVEVFDLRM